MSNYDNEFSKSDKLSSFPRKAQNWVRREFGAKKIQGNMVRKFKTCHKFRDDLGYGTILGLVGCVVFWNLRKSKVIRDINDKYIGIKRDTLNKVAWASTIVAKTISLGYYVKAIYDYKKC
ncbi:hypothetical protein LCGC14_0797730 [marine sediment metagenome]|uniref:Uncharacterized protein n=1 Tax=marine sediment metagenome TaxID=412755 RepID=A0A0F9QAC1_9ZZZZ